MKQMMLWVCVIVCTSIVLFGGLLYVRSLDQQYFQEHKKELTHRTVVQDAQGRNVSETRTYDKTPYHLTVNILFFAYVIIPLVVTIIAGARYVRRHAREQSVLLHSFVFVLTLALATYILQMSAMTESTGWDERQLAIAVIVVYSVIAFVIVCIMNGITLRRARIQKTGTK